MNLPRPTDDATGQVAVATNRTPGSATSVRRLPMTRVAVAAGAVLALTVATACTESREEAEQKATDKAAEEYTERITEAGGGQATVDEEGRLEVDPDQATVDTEDRYSSTGPEAKLPDDFPDSVPIPEGARLESASRSTAGSTVGWNVAGLFPEDSTRTFDEFLDLFADAGWSASEVAENEQDGGTVSVVTFTKDDLVVLASTFLGADDLGDSFSYGITGTVDGPR